MAGEISRINGRKGGRKKGLASIEAEKARILIAQKLKKQLKPIIQKAIDQAKEGDHKAREWLSERAYGKPVQALEVPEGTGEITIKWQNPSQ